MSDGGTVSPNLPPALVARLDGLGGSDDVHLDLDPFNLEGSTLKIWLNLGVWNIWPLIEEEWEADVTYTKTLAIGPLYISWEIEE